MQISIFSVGVHENKTKKHKQTNKQTNKNKQAIPWNQIRIPYILDFPDNQKKKKKKNHLKKLPEKMLNFLIILDHIK